MSVRRRRKRPGDAPPGSPNTTWGATKHSMAIMPKRTGSNKHRQHPLPVESIILAAIALYVAIESVLNNPQHQSSNLGDEMRSKFRIPWPAALTAISSLVACEIISLQCFFGGDAKDAKKQNGADPAGASIGSTLVPLLFSSAVLFTDGSATPQRAGPHDVLEAYAFASSITGLAFALGSLKWLRKSGSVGNYASAITRTAAHILFAFVILISIANIQLPPTSNDNSTLLVTTTIGAQAMLLYYYARPQRSGVCAAFTPGEWCCVSTLLSTLVVDFVCRYSPALDTTAYVSIARGGLVGSILGCTLAAFVPQPSVSKDVCSDTRTIFLQYSTKLCIIVGTTISCVEYAISQLPEKENDESPPFIPVSLQWLATFLSMPELVYAEQEEGECISGIPLYLQVPRWSFLAYWAIVLAVAAFPAAWMASFLLKLPSSSRKHRLVVVSRKYFHLVAVFLFLLPTIIAREMMVLSYAVALCVLILVETLRRTVPLQENKPDPTQSSINNFYEAFLDEKDVSGNGSASRPGRGKQSGVFVVTHMAMIFGCAIPLWVKDVLFRSVDTNCNSPACGLLSVIGIIALGVGDAAGAVVGVYAGRFRWPGTRRTVEGSLAMFLSMFLAVLAILINSPTSSSSPEGSTLSDAVILSCRVSPLLVILSILEAFTCQIDNLCLPLVGSALFLLYCRQ